jgi:hypothetical protein
MGVPPVAETVALRVAIPMRETIPMTPMLRS